MDRSMIDQFASYEGEGGLKGAMDVLNVERIFVPVEDNGVAIYSGQGEPFREIFKDVFMNEFMEDFEGEKNPSESEASVGEE